MIVVVASRHDQAARDIVAQWAAHDAALLTCEDLSVAGWRHRLFDPSGSRAVVSGQVIPESDIRGVLVRRQWIFEQELVHIASSDREYVAAEMNAFLVSWLSHLSCHVLNRPGGTCLCGPNWRPQQWVRAAATAGMKVETTRWRMSVPKKRTAAPSVRPPTQLTVVGERCVGVADEPSVDAVRRLASIAGTDWLSVQLADSKSAPRFLQANPMPIMKDDEVAQAVRDHLLSN